MIKTKSVAHQQGSISDQPHIIRVLTSLGCVLHPMLKTVNHVIMYLSAELQQYIIEFNKHIKSALLIEFGFLFKISVFKPNTLDW